MVTSTTTGRLTVMVSWEQEARRVLRTALHALAQEDLLEAHTAIVQRIGGDRLVLADVSGPAAITIRLRPFAELTLREVTQLALTTESHETRTRKISEVLALAGY